jgi:hypothetical protein
MLLTTSPATVRRDARQLRKAGKIVMTRGWKHDMGPGTTHKAQILDLYFKGYQFTEIELKTNHSESSVRRYLRDFTQVVALPSELLAPRSASDRLLERSSEYLDLFRDHGAATPSLLEPASRKRGTRVRAPHPQLLALRRPANRWCPTDPDKSLEQIVLDRFLNHYGYDKGEVTARAIVCDLLQLIEQYFLICRPEPEAALLKFGQMAWPGSDRGAPKRAQRRDIPMKLVIATFLCDDDIQMIRDGFKSKELRLQRMVRWIDQAFDQGALLSQLDLAVLLNVCDAVVSQYVNEYQRLTGRVLPTRGNIHDLSDHHAQRDHRALISGQRHTASARNQSPRKRSIATSATSRPSA